MIENFIQLRPNTTSGRKAVEGRLRPCSENPELVRTFGAQVYPPMRYCQELCSEECGSGGVSELKDSVGENLSLDEGEDEFW